MIVEAEAGWVEQILSGKTIKLFCPGASRASLGELKRLPTSRLLAAARRKTFFSIGHQKSDKKLEAKSTPACLSSSNFRSI